MSIGQGALQVTPLQSAIMFSVPANGGYRVQPWFGVYAPSNKPEIVVVAFGENSGDHADGFTSARSLFSA